MGPIEMTLIFIAALIVGVVLGVWQMRKKNAAWQSIATTLGLTFVEGNLLQDPQLRGEFDGVSVHAKRVVESSGDSKRIYISVTAQIRGRIPPGMRIYHEGVFQKLGKAVGADDIQVGDDDLDGNFIFRGSDPRRIRALATEPGVKRALLVGHQHCKSLRVEDREVHLKERHHGTDQTRLISCIRLCVDVAKAIDEACATPTQSSPAAATAAPSKPAVHQAATASDDPGDWW
jgi:hypothetical protein